LCWLKPRNPNLNNGETEMPKIEPFEKYGQRYEDWFEKNRFAYKSELRAIRAQLPESGDCIEIGVGSGRFASRLGIKLGIEPSKKMRELAKRRGIKVINGVAEALPFEDSAFDCALMITTICFLDNIETAFKEAYRVLKPGGSLIIGFVDKDSTIGKIYQRQKGKSIFYRIATFYSVDEVILYLRKSGFGELYMSQTIFHSLPEIKDIEPLKEGYGEGSFVVIKAVKRKL
jgi:ubiquinone/menaquinone biosynthesis C-methylase UbiE